MLTHFKSKRVPQFGFRSERVMVKQLKKLAKRALPKRGTISKNTKKGAQSKKNAQSKKVLCEVCGQSFSKTANLNCHIQKDHNGLRWLCHICGSYQVSKHSHLRHYKAKHNNELPPNVDENQRYPNRYVDMPTKAKYSMIARLTKELEEQKVLLKTSQKRLVGKLKENIELKSQLQIDCENDQLELTSLEAEIGDSQNEDPECTANDCGTEKEHDRDIGDNDDDDDEDDDESCEQSSYYPDRYPVTIEPIAKDIEAGSSK